ncbi:hypothetical protein [Nitrosomonas communis]|uniref:Uncharacterized protein n=1 Tax=Nitrosomonas communis TaxID=44574 RepID=A0A1I4UVJ7_9PROT|nr:hypothetical protein [Nitrosomonas communis]SFM92905.1 hypothetical protein SAMN05421863_107115 [Nitrosomonas communis]
MDKYSGMGGSYIIDPETGERRPADPVKDEPAAELNEYDGKGGSYIIDQKTGQQRPYDEREHLLIKPAGRIEPPATEPESEKEPQSARSKKKR